MDRKSWTIVLLCVIGIAINGWWMVKHPPVPKQKPAPAAPAGTTAGTTPNASTPSAPAGSTPAPAPAKEEKWTISTSDVKYTFTTKGGGILNAELLDTADHLILNSHGRAAIGTLSGAAKSVDDYDYRIVEKSESKVVFEAESPEHLRIRKEYSLVEGKGSSPHLINLTITLTNGNAAGGNKLIKDSLYVYTGAAASLRPDEIVRPGFCWNNAGDATTKDTNYFGKGMLGGETTEVRQSLDRLRWVGVMSRFYTHIINTKDDQPGNIWAERFLIDHSNDEFKDDSNAKKDFAIHGGLGLPPVSLDPQAKQDFELRIYLGPKVYRDLAAIDNVDPDRQLRYVMFYGWFTKVSQLLVWLMRVFHDWFSSWGAAIILLTIVIRTTLWPVQARANTTMKRMGLLSPKLKELQAKYKDEPQRQQQEMMKLYKEYGVNPLGGCLPMFIQLPIFFGFYRALQYAAELRGQSFLWVHDLSLPDTVGHFLGFAVNPLPLVMVVTNFLQIKLTPQPQATDNTQRRMFMFMPLIFLFICYSFASALALYWTTQNIFSILQAQIQRRFQKDPVLEKVAQSAPAARGAAGLNPQTPFGGSGKRKEKKPGPPRLGGGGTRSTRNDD